MCQKQFLGRYFKHEVREREKCRESFILKFPTLANNSCIVSILNWCPQELFVQKKAPPHTHARANRQTDRKHGEQSLSLKSRKMGIFTLSKSPSFGVSFCRDLTPSLVFHWCRRLMGCVRTLAHKLHTFRDRRKMAKAFHLSDIVYKATCVCVCVCVYEVPPSPKWTPIALGVPQTLLFNDL